MGQGSRSNRLLRQIIVLEIRQATRIASLVHGIREEKEVRAGSPPSANPGRVTRARLSCDINM